MKKPIRKAKTAPSFLHYLEGIRNGQPLELILTGHLVIEALLVELIQLKIVGDTPWKWNFPTKVKCCVDNGFVPASHGGCYEAFNNIRNDFAHVLGHKLVFDDVFALVEQLGKAGYDFSDETIYADRKLSEEWYGTDEVITEVLNAFYNELAWALHNNGGPDRLAGQN